MDLHRTSPLPRTGPKKNLPLRKNASAQKSPPPPPGGWRRRFKSLLRQDLPQMRHALVLKLLLRKKTKQMRLPRLKRKEKQMLQELSVNQVEQALAWLASPVQEPPPKELQKLNELEWFLLDRMLESLLQEKEQGPLQ